MIAMDLDGTLMERDKRILPDLVSTLRRLANAGAICVTATGRKFAFQTALFDAHGIGAESRVIRAIMCDEREAFVAQNGHYVPIASWNDAVRTRWGALFPAAWELLERMRGYAHEQGWDVTFFHERAVAYERGLPTIACETSAQALMLETWVQTWIAIEQLPFQMSRNLRRVQIIDSQAGKGQTLLAIAGHFGIPPANTLAIGDSANDLDMLDGRFGFHAATVGNADSVVKEIVQQRGGHIAEGHAGRGVIEILEKLVGDTQTQIILQ
ncbi:MAG: HAD family hydrolase [Thermomicrobiales bacterium]